MEPITAISQLATRGFFRLFAFFILLSAAPWALSETHSNVFRVFNVGLGLALLLGPSDRRLQVAVPLVFLADFAYRLPLVPNHDYLAAGLCLFLVIKGLQLITAKLGHSSAPEAPWDLESLRPFLVALAAVIYFFGFFHKLNLDFFNPSLSCAVTIVDETLAYLWPFPSGPAEALPPIGKIILAWAVIFIEALLLTLLLIARFRKLGLQLALMFHLILAPMVETFALLMAVALTLIAGKELLATLESQLGHRWTLKNKGFRAWLPVLGTLVVIAVYLGLGTLGDSATQRQLKPLITLPWLVPLIAWISWHLRGPTPLSPLAPLPKAALPLVALLFLNGWSPYLGWKTVTAYSMFSNLRTETESNHLLMPTLDLFGDQSKLWNVGLVDEKGQPVLIANDSKWSEFEIRRWIHHGELVEEKNPLGWTATLTIDGRVFDLKGEEIKTQSPFDKGHSMLERKLRLFRPVTPKAECAW